MGWYRLDISVWEEEMALSIFVNCSEFPQQMSRLCHLIIELTSYVWSLIWPLLSFSVLWWCVLPTPYGEPIAGHLPGQEPSSGRVIASWICSQSIKGHLKTCEIMTGEMSVNVRVTLRRVFVQAVLSRHKFISQQAKQQPFCQVPVGSLMLQAALQ